MPKIYVLELGCYSERIIFGVFSSEEKAQEAIHYLRAAEECAYYFNNDNYRVCAYDLDNFSTFISQNLHIFYVTMSYSGDIDSVIIQPEFYAQLGKVWEQGDAMLSIVVAAKDEAHAIKIAGEKRREYLVKEDL